MTESNYYEISATRGVNGRFQEGPLEYIFSVGAPNVIIPSKCYLRVEMELFEGATNPPLKEHVLAYADNACAGLFSNAYFRAGGQSISTNNQFVPQSHMLKMRASSTYPFLQSDAKDNYLLEANLGNRVDKVSADGQGSHIEIIRPSSSITSNITGANGTRQFQVQGGTGTFLSSDVGNTLVVAGAEYTIATVPNANTITWTVQGQLGGNIASSDFYLKRRFGGKNKVYCMYKPPLGIFDVDNPLASGDYSLLLTPNSKYLTSCVESLRGTVYALNIIDIKLFVYNLKMSIPNEITHLDLREMSVQTKPLSESLQFTVPSSTKSLTVFIQDTSAGNNTFMPPQKFKTLDGRDLNLQSIQITYANMTKTTTPWKSEFSSYTNLLIQRFYETYKELGMSDELSHETFSEFVQRGCFYHFDFERDMNNRSTEVQIQSAWTDIPQNANMFLCAWYSKLVDITTQNGQIVAVNTLSI